MKKTIDQLSLGGKRVIIRVDFNVPMKGKKITSSARIIAALPTIKKAVEDRAKVILLSHLGRVKEEADLEKKSLKAVSEELSRLLKEPIKFIPTPTGKEVKMAVKQLKAGEILMLENTRWEDLKNKAESKNDPALGKFWASLGDIFINDAFGTSHRAHASNVGIAANISESAIGYLVEKEVSALSKAINKPARPAVAIIGGAKVSDKIKTIENLLNKVDKLIIGGGMAFTFWKAQGNSVGKSLVEDDQIDLAKRLLKADLYSHKIILPIDAALSKTFTDGTPIFNKYNSLEIPQDLMGLDIGPKSIELFKKELVGAKTVIWNGPLGVTEFANYSKGTEAIAQAIGSLGPDAYTVVGGGDSVAAINKLNLADKFSHISTGGGACLAMLEGAILPGIAVIQEDTEPAMFGANDEIDLESELTSLKFDSIEEITQDNSFNAVPDSQLDQIFNSDLNETPTLNQFVDEADEEEVIEEVEVIKEKKETKPKAKKATTEKPTKKEEKPKKSAKAKAEPKVKATKEKVVKPKKEKPVKPEQKIETVVNEPVEEVETNTSDLQFESTSDLELRGGRRTGRRR